MTAGASTLQIFHCFSFYFYCSRSTVMPEHKGGVTDLIANFFLTVGVLASPVIAAFHTSAVPVQ